VVYNKETKKDISIIGYSRETDKQRGRRYKKINRDTEVEKHKDREAGRQGEA
jgi:hypothetical protein